MRAILIAMLIFGYLFGLVYMESEMVKVKIRTELLRSQMLELMNTRRQLEAELLQQSNLARVESEAQKRGFVIPRPDDILGVVE